MTADEQLDGFIAKFTPEVAAQTYDALGRMRKRLPGAVELVYDNYNALAIGFGATDRTSEILFSIAVFPRWVSLFFANGVSLPDPDGLLKGTGNKVRHIVLTEPALIESAGVERLIAETVLRAGDPIDPSARRRIIIKAVSANQRARRPR